MSSFKKRLSGFLVTLALLLFLSCKSENPILYKILLMGDDESEIEAQYTETVEQMLLSWNIPYKKIGRKPLSEKLFLKDKKIQFTTLIITKNFNRFSLEEINILKRISKIRGISIISFFSFVDDRAKEIFGIKKLSSEKMNSIKFEMIRRNDFICENFKRGESFRGGEFLKIQSKKDGIILESKGIPIFFFNKYGKGVNYYFNFHPKSWEVLDGKHLFLKNAMFQNSGNGFVYFDLEGIWALRCDDPLRNISWEDDQSYQKFYYKRMGKREWNSLIEVLRKYNAGMSLAVVTGFKDDGNDKRGELYVKGKKIDRRICGQIFDSKDIKYVFKIKDRKGTILDYEEEFEAIKFALKNYENLDVQPHGFLHLNPDISWCNASNKYNNSRWGVEFYDLMNKKDIQEAYQRWALEEGYIRIKNWFSIEPFIFVPPGLLVSSNTPEILKDFGYKYYFDGFKLKKSAHGMYKDLKFVQVLPVKALEWWIHQSYIRSCLFYPTILGLHDSDFLYFGMDWFEKFLNGWKKEGIKRFVSLGELLSMLSTKIYAEYDGKNVKIELDISDTNGPKSHGSSFFSKKKMNLKLKLPEKWEKRMNRETMDIFIPPFGEKFTYKTSVEF